MTATWYLYLDRLYALIDVKKNPITEITSIKYYDSDNAEQTLSTSLYDVDIESEPSRVCRSYSQTYPLTYDRPNAIND